MSSFDELTRSWDQAYAGQPPWDIGEPQEAYGQLQLEAGCTVVEFGCGTGENLMSFSPSARALYGFDVSQSAVASATAKAKKRGIVATFAIANVLDPLTLPQSLVGRVGTFIDSGTFHMFVADDRLRYVASVASLAAAHADCYLLCVEPDPARSWGPPGVTPVAASAAFGDNWQLASAAQTIFKVNARPGTLPAHLIHLKR